MKYTLLLTTFLLLLTACAHKVPCDYDDYTFDLTQAEAWHIYTLTHNEWTQPHDEIMSLEEMQQFCNSRIDILVGECHRDGVIYNLDPINITKDFAKCSNTCKCIYEPRSITTITIEFKGEKQ